MLTKRIDQQLDHRHLIAELAERLLAAKEDRKSRWLRYNWDRVIDDALPSLSSRASGTTIDIRRRSAVVQWQQSSQSCEVFLALSLTRFITTKKVENSFTSKQ